MDVLEKKRPQIPADCPKVRWTFQYCNQSPLLRHSFHVVGLCQDDEEVLAQRSP